MQTIQYIAEVLSDGHLTLPQEIKNKMGLSIRNKVKVILEKSEQIERIKRMFGMWARRKDIKNGSKYVQNIRTDWKKRTAKLDKIHA